MLVKEKGANRYYSTPRSRLFLDSPLPLFYNTVAMAPVGSVIQRPLAVMMSRQIRTIAPDALVIDAARMMQEAKVGALLVAEGTRFIGLVSESDLVRRVLAVGGDAHQIRVSDVVTTPLITIDMNRSAHEASDLMAERGIRHLAVMDQGAVVGMLSVRDLLRYFKNWGGA